MKKINCLLLVFILAFVCLIGLSGCANDKAGTSSKIVSYSFASEIKNYSVTIKDSTLIVKTNYQNEIKTTYYNFENGKLASANFEMTAPTQEAVKTVYEYRLAANKTAPQPMYENIKLDGKKLTCDITLYTLEHIKDLSIEEMKEYFELELSLQ